VIWSLGPMDHYQIREEELRDEKNFHDG
jgi:hypothetical protein